MAQRCDDKCVLFIICYNTCKQVALEHNKKAPNQTWTYNPTSELLISKLPSKTGNEGGLVLDIQHAKKQSGSNIVVFSKRHPNNNKSQKWFLAPYLKPLQLEIPHHRK